MLRVKSLKAIMSEDVKVIIRIKGAKYYKASEVFAKGELAKGCLVSLKPEPNNKYDSNAVAIYSCNGKMLGHISKDIAEKYQKLCLENQITSSKVVSAERIEGFAKFDIKISITYSKSSQPPPKISNLAQSDTPVPEKPGIYEISCGTDKFYIGASGNLRNRRSTHLNNLSKNVHSNQLIQRDFNKFGEARFKFLVLRLANSLREAEIFEAEEIVRRLQYGDSLYNKTIDGKGTVFGKNAGEKSISDVYGQGVPLGVEISHTKTAHFQEQSTVKIAAQYAAESEGSGVEISQNNTKISELVLDDNSIYEGDLVSGKANGKGKLTWPNGDIYSGEFLENKPAGLGAFVWADGTIYKGEVTDGKITGKGAYFWPNGDKLEGDFINGRRIKTNKFTRG